MLEDVRHSAREARLHALGHTDAGRLLHISFTLRADGKVIRVISARARFSNFDALSASARFADQSCIFYRDDTLVCEHTRHLKGFVIKWADALAIYCKGAN
jgi:hypothetical protein